MVISNRNRGKVKNISLELYGVQGLVFTRLFFIKNSLYAFFFYIIENFNLKSKVEIRSQKCYINTIILYSFSSWFFQKKKKKVPPLTIL